MEWWGISLLRQKREIKEIQIMINKDVLVRTDWKQGIVGGNKL